MSTEAIVNQWAAAAIPNSPVSRDVAALNHLHARLPNQVTNLSGAGAPAQVQGIVNGWYSTEIAGAMTAEALAYLRGKLPVLVEALDAAETQAIASAQADLNAAKAQEAKAQAELATTESHHQHP